MGVPTAINWVGRACWWMALLHELILSTVLASPKVFADGRQSGPDIALAPVRPTADDEFVAITKRHPDCR